MSSHLLEIINKNLEFQKNYIEFELLDTKFAGFAKYISPVVTSLKNEVKGAELSSAALIELYDELIEYHTRLKSYEEEIAAYALQSLNKTITFERLEYLESFKEQIQVEDVANNEVLQYLVLRVIDIRKRQIIIRKVLGDMAMLEKLKSIDEMIASITGTDKKHELLALHPSLKIAVFGCFSSYESAYSGQGGTVYSWTGYKVQVININNDFTVGSIIAERMLFPGSGLTAQTIPAATFEFTSLGDAGRLEAHKNDSSGEFIDEIVDFSEYGLALSPNWQGVTLDIIKSRG